MTGAKIAIIVPYRDRREQLDTFVPHMVEFFKNKDVDYKIFIIEQSDDKPFNYGKLCNIGFSLFKEGFDYFCFHDIDMLPVSDDCDYNYIHIGGYPVHMSTKVSAHTFKLPYLEYFGGVVMFSKEDFEKINGYSNEYYGWGFADLDLLHRCRINEIELDEEIVFPRIDSYYEFEKIKITDKKYSESIKYIDFKDNDLYLKIFPNNQIKDLTKDSFSVSLWFNKDEIAKEEEYLVSWPGFNTGISLQNDGTIRVNVYDNNREYCFAYKRYELGVWNHVAMVVDYNKEIVELYLNSVKVPYTGDQQPYIVTPLIDYSYQPIYIGCASLNSAPYKGKLSNLLMFDYVLEQKEIDNIYLEGYDNKKQNTDLEPVLNINFSKIYHDFILDSSITMNHVKMHSLDFTDYSKFIKNDVIQKTSKLSVPSRIMGKYQSLIHDDDDKITEKFYSWDPDIVQNSQIYFDEVLTGKVDTQKIGLNYLNYKILSEEDINENTKWIKVVL
jgi:hypothetical protein